MNERLNLIILHIGLVLVMIVIHIKVGGNINSWGTLSPYIASYFHSIDSSITIADFVIVNSIACAFESGLSVLVAYAIRLAHPFYVSCIGALISAMILFASSYITNPHLFCWVFGLAMGSFSASIFFPCLWIVWNQIPENKARLSGFALIGYSLGPMIFGFIFTMIVNPDDYQAENVESDGNEDQKMFGHDVTNRVPKAIRLLCLCLLTSYIIGITFLKRKWKVDIKEGEAGKATMTFSQMIKSLKVWNLFFIAYFSVTCLTYIANTYKIIGMLYINNDHFTTYVGSIGSFAGCIGCLIFGILFDKYSWKLIMTCDCILVIMLYATFQVSLNLKYLYGFYVIMLYFFTMAGYIGIVVQTDRDFPEDKWIVPYVCLGLIPAYTMPYIFEKFITPIVGYFATFIIVAGITAIAMLQSIFHPVSVVLYYESLNS